MQDARAIANLVLSKFDAHEFDITNIKINKLTYLLHGWYLLRKEEPLIRNHIEAWQYGPVIKVVYDAFKIHTNSAITSRAKYFDYQSNREAETEINPNKGTDLDLVEKVASYYVRFSTPELIRLTHEIGSPWYKIFHQIDSSNRLNKRIPNDLIYNHFFLVHGDRKRH